MKNYKKEGQSLPLYGIGPSLVVGMAILTIIGIVLSCSVFSTWNCSGIGLWVFRAMGVLLIILGLTVWYISALRSEMNDHILDNKLKIDGIYAWTRNPMYSGWWMFLTGISFLWHNYCLLFSPLLCWGLMTVVLKNTEEKWLTELYGEEYCEYKKKVNRCIPWKKR